MRLFCFPLLILLASGCTSERDKIIQKARLAEAEAVRKAKPSHTLKAFNGTIYGKDIGEWGGEIGFAPTHGDPYQLVPENSAGLFDLDNRVIAFTGLTHLGANYGHAFELTADQNGHVNATKTLDLPAAPCDAKKIGHVIQFRAVTGYIQGPNKVGRPIFTCFTLDSKFGLHSVSCPDGLPDYCSA